MTFLWRDVLWLLLLLPILVAAYVAVLSRRKHAVRYSHLGFMREAMARAQRLRPHIPPFVFLLALLTLLIAAARPTAVATLAAEQRTIVLAIDVSMSMAATDVAPTRIEAAQAAARAFIRAQPPDVRVGIIAFAGDADLVQTPTTRRSDALAAIDRLQLQYHTAIGTGLIAALQTIFPETDITQDYDIFGFGRSPVIPRRYARNQAQKRAPENLTRVPPASFSSAAIILLTDGRATFGMHHAKAAQMAADRGVRVYTVGFGDPNPTTIDLDGEAYDVSFDEEALKDIAEITHAAYFHASTADELNAVYRTLKGQVVLERKRREVTALFTALGAVLSLTSAGLSFAWGSRLV